jgi:molecular chaperone IbpA
MRSIDFSPLYRSTVGFDRLFEMLDNGARHEWPPYNIERTGEDDYRIKMAIAGYDPAEVELTQHGSELIVAGQKKVEQNNTEVLHEGLAISSFRQVFRLADHVKVASATMENGLLSIELLREIPEALKPRRIEISASAIEAGGDGQKQLAGESEPQRKAA